MKAITRKYIEEMEKEYNSNVSINIEETVLEALEIYDIRIGNAYINCSKAARAILLSEAVNCAAKFCDDMFYSFKTELIVHALEYDENRGWIIEDDYGNKVYHLYNKEVGTSSFHSTFEDICSLNYVEWKFEWSGIYRQDHAIALLSDEKLLQIFADITRPRRDYNLCKIRNKYIDQY